MDLVLSVNRIDYQVNEIDFKIQKVVTMFSDVDTESAIDWSEQLVAAEGDRGEFSYYKRECFTSTMRLGPGRFIKVPNNTLAKNDIIRLIPGDTAPALIELIPFDIDFVQTPSGKKVPVMKPNAFNDYN